MLTALGVVYGDIGTSPLYAMRECFHGAHAIAATPGNILGVVSLIFWALILSVSVYYLGLILKADNNGEGGILALMALALSAAGKEAKSRRKTTIVILGLFGAALLYGDGVITPAISVLSAWEGLRIWRPELGTGLVVNLTVITLVGLFLVQRKGTAKVGRLFGPVMLLWFGTLGVLGLRSALQNPVVFGAINPLYAIRFFIENGWHGFIILGSVFLVVTGNEALYADMGHFGRRPIRLAWFFLVLPGLLLNYFGQAALLLRNPAAAENPFYRLAPEWGLIPLVLLAMLATVIASQALISGAFSITQQAVQLGYIPRVEIIHTSEREKGQIYIPAVNWGLLLAVIPVVLAFRSSTNLAAAYGIAVTTTMVITTLLTYIVVTKKWGWRPWVGFVVILPLLTMDLSFFGANILKFFDGGYFPLLIGAVIFTLMTTWKTGRQILSRRLQDQVFPLEYFLASLQATPPIRVPGTAVFMTGNAHGTPPALLHNWKHNKVIHEKVVLLTVSTVDIPHVRDATRMEISTLEQGFFRIVVRYGFMETPSVPEILKMTKEKGLPLKLMETSFFLGRETLIPTKQPGMAIWREALFAWMSRNARPATSFFKIPPNRVVELGSQIEL
ncbi:MAG: potassium transporter Kup [Myxococcota bacterium]|nr:potassium transporter Kup [Myxococcota bacterium]